MAPRPIAETGISPMARVCTKLTLPGRCLSILCLPDGIGRRARDDGTARSRVHGPGRRARARRESAAACRLHGRAHGGALLAQLGQGLVEDGLAVFVGAPFLHVGQMGLVGLGLRRGGRVGGVLSGRETAPRAVPLVGDRDVAGKAGARLMLVGAVERDPDSGRGLPPLGLSHRSRSDAAPSDGVATTHGLLLAFYPPPPKQGRPALPTLPPFGRKGLRRPWP